MLLLAARRCAEAGSARAQSNEDVTLAEAELTGAGAPAALFCVFDGHCGRRAAEQAAQVRLLMCWVPCCEGVHSKQACCSSLHASSCHAQSFVHGACKAAPTSRPLAAVSACSVPHQRLPSRLPMTSFQVWDITRRASARGAGAAARAGGAAAGRGAQPGGRARRGGGLGRRVPGDRRGADRRGGLHRHRAAGLARRGRRGVPAGARPLPGAERARRRPLRGARARRSLCSALTQRRSFGLYPNYVLNLISDSVRA